MAPNYQAGDQYVIFTLGLTRFAASIHQVLRITPRLPMTRVPRAPDFLEGVINDHSQVVPVVDLRKRMGLAKAAADQNASRILILELEDQTLGLLVDSVLDVARIEQSKIMPPPALVAQVNGVYLTGVAQIEENVLLLLDLERILTVDEVGEVATWRDGSPRDRIG
jgi:purine-binding chemotaxis protein CheW